MSNILGLLLEPKGKWLARVYTPCRGDEGGIHWVNSMQVEQMPKDIAARYWVEYPSSSRGLWGAPYRMTNGGRVYIKEGELIAAQYVDGKPTGQTQYFDSAEALLAKFNVVGKVVPNE